jgi:hypothetical protein
MQKCICSGSPRFCDWQKHVDGGSFTAGLDIKFSAELPDSPPHSPQSHARRKTGRHSFATFGDPTATFQRATHT